MWTHTAKPFLPAGLPPAGLRKVFRQQVSEAAEQHGRHKKVNIPPQTGFLNNEERKQFPRKWTHYKKTSRAFLQGDSISHSRHSNEEPCNILISDSMLKADQKPQQSWWVGARGTLVSLLGWSVSHSGHTPEPVQSMALFMLKLGYRRGMLGRPQSRFLRAKSFCVVNSFPLWFIPTPATCSNAGPVCHHCRNTHTEFQLLGLEKEQRTGSHK